MYDLIELESGEVIRGEIHSINNDRVKIVLFDGSSRQEMLTDIRKSLKQPMPEYLHGGFINAMICDDEGYSLDGISEDIIRSVLLMSDISRISGVIKTDSKSKTAAVHKFDGSVQIVDKEDILSFWQDIIPIIPEVLQVGYKYIRTEPDKVKPDPAKTIVYYDILKDKEGNVYCGIAVDDYKRDIVLITTYDGNIQWVDLENVTVRRHEPVPEYLREGYLYLYEQLAGSH